MTNKEIFDKVKSLKYKNDEITLVNVYPSLIEDIFDFPKGIDIIGGRDLDYEAENNEYYINGSAYYGKCTFTKKNGIERPIKEIKTSNDNKYTRTSFEKDGRLIENVPSVIECSLENLDELIKEHNLKLFYICFNGYCNSTLTRFYAKDERDVRLRALSIWGRYDDIKTEEQVKEIRDKYKDIFSRSYKIEDKFYVLDWK